MVTINATIIVQVVLYLVFLWGLKQLVLDPMMAVRDKREDDIEHNKDAAKNEAARAKQLEEEYVQRVSEARRASLSKVREAERAAMRERGEAISKHHAESDAAVRQHFEQAMQQVEAQRGELDQMAPALAELIVEQLRTKETAAQ